MPEDEVTGMPEAPSCAAAGRDVARMPAVVVHDAADAAAALALAGPRGVLLLSAPGAAGSLGAPWFLALVAAALAQCPSARCLAALDCADAPGQALAALRAGARILVLDPACPAFAAVQGAAEEAGAHLLPARPPALDLGGLALDRPAGRARLRAWLRGGDGEVIPEDGAPPAPGAAPPPEG